MQRAARVFDAVLRAVAIGLAASLVVACWRDVSHGYDIWYYHLPFAARLTGLIDPATYAFSADNAGRYAGFPLLGELLQGIAWRVTGHVEATNLVSLVALFAVPLFLWRTYLVAPWLSLIALLAIPLVHIHATSSYVDLPANVCVTLLLLCVWRAAVTLRPSTRLVAGALALGAAAANVKFQVVPVTGIALAALFAIAMRVRGARRRHALLFVLATPIVLATPLKNAALHGNPVWPVELSVLGRSLPHREKAYAQSPPHLAGSPRPVRFVRSALEIDNRPLASGARWSLDQWAPPDDPSCRMGGYFGAYVVANLVALGLALRRRTREARAAAIVFGVVTAVAALVPQSHELRYYMHWMLLLVCLNLALWAKEAPAVCGAIAAAALAIVVWATGATFIHASGISFAELRVRHVDRAAIDGAAPGERLCVAREPWTFLYAPLFDQRKDYAVQEASTEADCGH